MTQEPNEEKIALRGIVLITACEIAALFFFYLIN